MFDATHCLRPKDRMDEFAFDALDIGDVVLVEMCLVRDSGTEWTVIMAWPSYLTVTVPLLFVAHRRTS